MGLCCSNEERGNSHFLKLPEGSDQGKIEVPPHESSRSEPLIPAQVPAAAASEKLLLGMRVEDIDARSLPPDGGGTWPDAQQLKKTMAEIDVFGFKIVAKSSCSPAAKGPAEGGRTASSMHVELRNGNNTLEIESRRKETVVSVNQKGRRVEEIPNDAMKVDWFSLLSSGQLNDSYSDSSSAVRKAANRLEAIRSQKNTVGCKKSSPEENGTTRIQANYQKKESMSCKVAAQKANSFSRKQESEEISIFSAENYFTEEEPTVAAGRRDETSYIAKRTMTPSGFRLHIGEDQQCRLRHQAKPEFATDLEFPASTASESDIWGKSSMEDGASLANFKERSLQKTGSQQETSSMSSKSASLKKKHEEICLFGSEQEFDRGKKEKLVKIQPTSAKAQWHLAQVNSHEFVMSPNLQFSDNFICPSSSKADQKLCEMKQEANEEHGSQALEVPRAFEVVRDEFSFDSLSSSCEKIPLDMPKASAARDPAVNSVLESSRGSDSEHAKSSWTSPVHAHEQNNEKASSNYTYQAATFRTKSFSPFASPDLLMHDNKTECYHLPSLNRSFSDLRGKLYQSPGNYPKMHGRNESDDYQSDMSADLFEIDRLEAPSSVSSPPTPPRISVWELTTPLAMP